MNIAELVGQTIFEIKQGDDELIIVAERATYKMWHHQDCCENVQIEDIVGDLEDLRLTPILVAEERTSKENPKDKYDESFTWTFYELRTIKGSVTIRWYGESNGYYSEEATFDSIDDSPLMERLIGAKSGKFVCK